MEASGLSFFKKKAISTPEKLKRAKYVMAAVNPSLKAIAREAMAESKIAKGQLVAMAITAKGKGAKSVERLKRNAIPLLNSKSIKDKSNQKININLFSFNLEFFWFPCGFFLISISIFI